jgi:hypothetical protein
MNAPDIAGLVQGQTYEPVFAFGSEWRAVGYLCRYADSAG